MAASVKSICEKKNCDQKSQADLKMLPGGVPNNGYVYLSVSYSWILFLPSLGRFFRQLKTSDGILCQRLN